MTRSVFISYSQHRDERRTLWEALREHGLRPWRDVEDLLAATDTQRDIEAEIAECETVVLWLSEEIFASGFVTDVEIPAIRAAIDARGIRVLPVFDGLTVDDADRRAQETWDMSVMVYNGHKVDRDNPIEAECSTIARGLVRSTLRDAADSAQSPVIRAVTRDDTAAHKDDAVLDFDWRHAYDSGELPNADVTEQLNANLGASMGHLKAVYPAGPVTVSLKTHLHVALAIGHALRRPTGLFPVIERDGTHWVAEATEHSANTSLDLTTARHADQSTTASVEISISRDVTSGVDAYVEETGTRYVARLSVQPETGPGQTSLTDPDTANAWARQITDEMAALMTSLHITSFSIFMACPVEFAVLLGWWMNAAGPINIFHWQGNTGPYRHVWTLPAV